MATSFTHFVFVDFENVPVIDLGLVEGKPVHVMLLIGKKQTWLDLPLVRQIHRLAAQVELVEVGASGRNALDLTLACYLGQAVERTPGVDFHIVSKDKDFEPMIAHLQQKGVRVARHDRFESLPFLAPKRNVRSKPPIITAKAVAETKPAAGPKAVAPARPEPVADRFSKLIQQMKGGGAANRPKKRSTLEHHIAAFYGNKLTPDEVSGQIEQLIRRRVIAIDDKGRISYP